MTTPTPRQSEEMLNFILNTIITLVNKDAKNYPIKCFLDGEGIDSFESLLSLDDSDFENPSYQVYPDGWNPGDNEPPTIRMKKGNSRVLRNVVRWIKYLIDQKGEMISRDEVLALTQEQFQNYTVLIAPRLGAITPPNGPRTNATTNAPITKPKNEFFKTVKKDKTQYTKLTKDEDMDAWHRTFKSTARTHECNEILDTQYVPGPNDKVAVELFQQQQTFMYSVFDYALQTDVGKDLVRKHESTLDAQAIYVELQDHMSKSTAASLKSSEVIEYLTSSVYDSTWTQGALKFVLYWHNQARQYNELRSSEADKISEAMKLSLLQKAVNGVDDLRRVKTTAETLAAHNKKEVTYQQYYDLLISAATSYDAELRKASKAQAQRRRRVYLSETNGLDDELLYEEEQNLPTFEPTNDLIIDMAPSQFLAINETRRRPPFKPQGSREPREPPDDGTIHLPRDIWESLTNAQRESLLAFNRSVRAKVSGERPLQPNARRANEHAGEWSLINGEHESVTGSTAQRTVQFAPQHSDQSQDKDKILNTSNMSRDEESTFISQLSSGRSVNQADIRSVLSANKSKQTQPHDEGELMSFNGKKWRAINQCQFKYTYKVTEHNSKPTAALVDRGANGGLAGADVRVLDCSDRRVNITGIDSHQVTGLEIVTAAGKVVTTQGPVIILLHQYAYLGQGKTIHSSGQMEHHGIDVCDKSKKIKSGKQRIVTIDGYTIPLAVRDGLVYMDMKPPTDIDMQELNHVILTSDMEWDPSILDNEIDTDDIGDPIHDEEVPPYGNTRFTADGTYAHRVVASLMWLWGAVSTYTLFEQSQQSGEQKSGKCQQKRVPPDLESLQPKLGFAPLQIIEKTLDVTTQFYRNVIGLGKTPMREHYKTRSPAANCPRRHEPVATDWVYSDTPAIDSGAKGAQIFIGTKTLVADCYGAKTDGQFINHLLDEIRKRGAMDKLISDRAQSEISNAVYDVLRGYGIQDWQSEPHHQNQNPFERRYAHIKAYTNNIMNRTGAPAYTWLLCLCYVCLLLNCLACEALNWTSPHQALTGQQPDISALVQFHFYEPVYYKTHSQAFPSDSEEKLGYWVGIAENCGDALTYKILTEDTLKVIPRSTVRSAAKPQDANLRVDPAGGERDQKPILFVKSRNDLSVDPTGFKPMSSFDPGDLIRRTYLLQPEGSEETFRARVMRKIIDNSEKQVQDRVKFLVRLNDQEADEIITYTELVDFLNDQEEDDPDLFRFRAITGHQGPLNSTDKDYKGSKFNVMVEWETGEVTYEPLDLIAKDDPVTCAMYAKDHGLLETPGWKRFKRLAKRRKILERAINQSKLRQHRRSPKFKFGYEVAQNHNDAMRIDALTGTTRYKEAEEIEFAQLDEYETFKVGDKAIMDKKGRVLNAPKGYTRVRMHCVYDVKHDGRHKCRAVANGSMTDVPVESVYSGVVSLRSLRMVVFLAELNNLELWGADVGNAYLESYTKEKNYVVAGPEFGAREGHILIIQKALYGLRSSGLCFHEKFSETLKDMGFASSKADADVWMRENDGIYEYIAVYVDDLAIAMKDPQSFISELKSPKYNYKLKGVGPLNYHLGCNFERDGDGTLRTGPKQYIEKMMDWYESTFGEKAKTASSPLEKGDHPELDNSDLVDEVGISQYQAMIGQLQWLVSLGRIDVFTATMSMARWRAAPKKGHLDRLKRIYGYVRKMNNGFIRVRIEEPDYSNIPDPNYDWSKSVYGEMREMIPEDAPNPLGKPVVLTTYVDANLYHDVITG